MKVSAAALALLLIAASFSQTFSGPVGPNLPTCCFSYTKHKLPWKRIERHYVTSTNCPQQAIVFVTNTGRQVCANPDDTWVQNYLQILKKN